MTRDPFVEQFAASTVDYYGVKRAPAEARTKAWAFESKADQAAYIARVDELCDPKRGHTHTELTEGCFACLTVATVGH